MDVGVEPASDAFASSYSGFMEAGIGSAPMSRLQELHPDQQAVLQLVLRRRLRYAELAGMLGLTPEGVRERALDAIDGLAPEDVEGLAMEDRDRIADHLLGQDDGAERDASAALILQHPPAGIWAGTVAAELGPLGGPAVPPPDPAVAPDDPTAAPDDPTAAPDESATAPDESGAAPPASAAPGPDDDAVPAEAKIAVPAEAKPSGAYQAPADGPLVHGAPLAGAMDVGAAFAQLDAEQGGRPRRRNPFAGQPPAVLAGSAAALVVVVLLALWVGGAFGGGDDESSSASAPPAGTTTADASAEATAEQRAVAAQFVAALPRSIRFRPPASATGTYARVTGTAVPRVSAQNAALPVLALTIRGLPAPTGTRRYFAWADKNGSDPIFLGQLTNAGGAELPFQGVDLETRQGAVVDPTVYSRVRVTLEGSEAPTKPGRTIIVGTITPRTS